MIKVFILVEGPTEESFVNKILIHHFDQKDVFLIPIIVTTKLIKSGGKFRGGITTYRKVKNEVLNLLKDSSVTLVTTMIDLYGLPKDFPGQDLLPNNSNLFLSHLEDAFEKDINSKKFKAFFTKHEFEGLLFSKPEEIAKKLLSKSKIEKLKKIRNEFVSPEDINDNPETAPSKRILKLIPDYNKISDGTIIAKRIGLDVIRKECKHFNNWITFIENFT